MPDDISLIGSILISTVIIILFIYLYASALFQTWRNPANPPKFGERYVYVATALAGLVGALVAAGFNQQLPEAVIEAALAEEGIEQSLDQLPQQDILEAVGAAVLPSSTEEWRTLFSIIYSFSYLALGIASLVTWVKEEYQTPDFVKSLASIFFALMLAIGRSFLAI
ncbi:MAG TPA: hypothetical protein VKY59_07625 [Spirillospora sp.]|nr:hypothetical protein [Spirillospora sp.]